MKWSRGMISATARVVIQRSSSSEGMRAVIGEDWKLEVGNWRESALILERADISWARCGFDSSAFAGLDAGPSIPQDDEASARNQSRVALMSRCIWATSSST